MSTKASDKIGVVGRAFASIAIGVVVFGFVWGTMRLLQADGAPLPAVLLGVGLAGSALSLLVPVCVFGVRRTSSYPGIPWGLLTRRQRIEATFSHATIWLARFSVLLIVLAVITNAFSVFSEWMS